MKKMQKSIKISCRIHLKWVPYWILYVDGFADFFIENNINEEPEKFHPTAQIDFKMK